MKSDYYIVKKKDSMLIIRRGGTFLPTPGHVRVNDQNNFLHTLVGVVILHGHY